MRAHAGDGIAVMQRSDDWGQIAIQGPNAPRIVDSLCEPRVLDVPYYHFREAAVAGVRDCIVARTGYTGEDGFEVFVPPEGARKLWDALLEKRVVPCGLGARDSLRLEVAYRLYGNDMDEQHTPLEAGLGGIVKLDKPGGFVGSDALTRQKQESLKRRPAGFKLTGKGIARHGYTVRKDATYTGLYLYGERTYLELLQPDSASFGAPSGVAYGVEERGGLESLRGALPSPKLEEIARGDVPWFRSLRSGQPLEGLAEWVMEYVPAFFRGFHPELPPAHPAIARSDALTRYAASCGILKDRAEGLFEDVVALEIALAPADWQRWRSRPLRVEEADLRVTSAPPGTPTGVLAAHLRLRRDAGRSTERIGSTTLSLDGKDAVWRFQRGLHGELS